MKTYSQAFYYEFYCSLEFFTIDELVQGLGVDRLTIFKNTAGENCNIDVFKCGKEVLEKQGVEI